MLAGTEVAKTSACPDGETLTSTPYHLHDTVGLNGVTNSKDAVEKLSELLRKVDGGVHLLVYVNEPRLHEYGPHNYKLFYEGICQTKVPTVVVVTRLENENMED